MVLWVYVEKPGADPDRVAKAFKGTGLLRLRRFGVRRAIGRLLERGLLHEDEDGRYTADADARRFLRVAMAARELELFMPESLANLREWDAGRGRGDPML